MRDVGRVSRRRNPPSLCVTGRIRFADQLIWAHRLGLISKSIMIFEASWIEDTMEWATFLPALTGGLAGAAFTLAAQFGLQWYRRPILSFDFSDEKYAGIIVDAPWSYIGSGGEAVIGQRRSIRCRVANRGRSVANNVSCSIERIEITTPGSGKSEFAEEVFDLKLAGTDHDTKFNLPPGSHRFVDVAHSETHSDSRRFYFDFSNRQRPLDHIYRTGTHKFWIVISADNAKPCRGTFWFKWDGIQIT